MADILLAKDIGLMPHNGFFFFTSRRIGGDAEINEYLKIFPGCLKRFAPAYDVEINPTDWLHGNVVRFIQGVCRFDIKGVPGQLTELATEVQNHVRYLNAKCKEFGVSEPADWLHGIKIAVVHPDARRVLLEVVQETIDHLTARGRECYPNLGTILPTVSASRTADASRTGFGAFDEVVPLSVLQLKTEANLPVLRPWFELSLPLPGDVAEFGCYKGTLSIKFAFYLGALKQAKTVYAFDTFEGFQIADPGGGALGVGAYEDNDNAYDELQKWSKVLPLVPVKGDARETCKMLSDPLSFVWLDLDMGVLMEPVFDQIQRLCSSDTVIGVDDYGRPETPTVKPWADAVEQRGVWTKLREYRDTHIAFYRKNF
jgi:hypothetical protein